MAFYNLQNQNDYNSGLLFPYARGFCVAHISDLNFVYIVDTIMGHALTLSPASIGGIGASKPTPGSIFVTFEFFPVSNMTTLELSMVTSNNPAGGVLGGVTTYTQPTTTNLTFNPIPVHIPFKMKDIERKLVAPKKDTKYPHKCPQCNHAAYAGFFSVECSNGKCMMYKAD